MNLLEIDHWIGRTLCVPPIVKLGVTRLGSVSAQPFTHE